MDALLDLGREAFLYLESAGIDIDHTGDLTQARDAAVGNISYVHLAEERQHMVLA